MANFVDVAAGGAKSWLSQKGYEMIRPIVRGIVHKMPELKPDTPIEKTVLEVASALPGVIKAIYPDQRRVNNIISDVVREFIQELKTTAEKKRTAEAGNDQKPADGGGGKKMRIMRSVWVSDDPLIGYADECRLAHHLEEVETNKRRRYKGKGEQSETKYAVKSGFRQISFESFVLSRGTPPPFEPGCTCLALFDIDRIEYEKQKAEERTGVAKPGNQPVSFSRFIGMARRGKINDVDAAKVDAFLDLFVRLPLDKRLALGEVDNEDEFVAVVLARNLEEMGRIIGASKDKVVVSGIASLLNIPSDLVHGVISLGSALAKMGGPAKARAAKAVGSGINATATAVKTAAEQVPAKIGAYGGRLERLDRTTASDLRKRRDELKQKRAAAKAEKGTP